MLRLLLAPLLLLAACAGPTAETLLEDPTSGPAWTVYLVRHAEKTADQQDPGLTPTGEARAMTLQLMLRSAKLDAIHSTDYRRTKDTVATLAAWRNLQLRFYDPRALDALALELRLEGGQHLVVGHSNTTPAMVAALGGEPGSEIREDEYDRLYVVTGGDGSEVRTLLLHFQESALE
jgi:broad specificity phosphatase PhoE